METHTNFDEQQPSQKCLYCLEKDEMLKKYQKLVDLLKRKTKRSTIFSSTCGQNFFHEISSELRNINEDLSNKIKDEIIKYNQTSSLQLYSSSEQLRRSNNSKQSFDPIKPLQDNNLRKTAPTSFFNQEQDESVKIGLKQKGKRISLSSQWHDKFLQYTNTIEQNEKKINGLFDQVLQLKNERMYIKNIFLQLYRALKEKFEDKIESKLGGYNMDIVNLIIHIFQYSQEELNQKYGVSLVKKEKDKENKIYVKGVKEEKLTLRKVLTLRT